MALGDYIERIPGGVVAYCIDMLGGHHWRVRGGFDHGEREPWCLGFALRQSASGCCLFCKYSCFSWIWSLFPIPNSSNVWLVGSNMYRGNLLYSRSGDANKRACFCDSIQSFEHDSCCNHELLHLGWDNVLGQVRTKHVSNSLHVPTSSS